MSHPVARLAFRPSRRALLGAALGFGVAGLPACSEAPAEPRAIKWGRDVCDFCHMTFGDRRYAAEIWDPTTHRARIYDDFGCSVLAAADMGVLDRADVAWWVSDDADPTRWIDARTARYRGDVVTPMGYGHSAGTTPAHTLDFTAAAVAIREKAECEHHS
jgi:nitrous oxide reductase accessory protein NosL